MSPCCLRFDDRLNASSGQRPRGTHGPALPPVRSLLSGSFRFSSLFTSTFPSALTRVQISPRLQNNRDNSDPKGEEVEGQELPCCCSLSGDLAVAPLPLHGRGSGGRSAVLPAPLRRDLPSGAAVPPDPPSPQITEWRCEASQATRTPDLTVPAASAAAAALGQLAASVVGHLLPVLQGPRAPGRPHFRCHVVRVRGFRREPDAADSWSLFLANSCLESPIRLSKPLF